MGSDRGWARIGGGLGRTEVVGDPKELRALDGEHIEEGEGARVVGRAEVLRGQDHVLAPHLPRGAKEVGMRRACHVPNGE